MIAVDTNVLTYAHWGETAWHHVAASRLVALAEGAERWGLPVVCMTEFLRVHVRPCVSATIHPQASDGIYQRNRESSEL